MGIDLDRMSNDPTYEHYRHRNKRRVTKDRPTHGQSFMRGVALAIVVITLLYALS